MLALLSTFGQLLCLIAIASASIVGLTDYDRLVACPSDDLPADGVRKLELHQLPERSIAGCVLSCHTTESCAAASMVAEHRWCLLATAEAFLTAWLHGHGQCDSIAVSSLRILYHFRVGSFNLAPVHRNPHTPVLVSAVLNRSAGAFVTGESGSFIDVSTADGIEDLFVPEPNVTVFMRAKFDFNGDFPTSTSGAYRGFGFVLDASVTEAKFYNSASGGTSTVEVEASTSDSGIKEANFNCMRIGVFEPDAIGRCLRGFVECFAIFSGQLSAAQFQQLNAWRLSNQIGVVVPHQLGTVGPKVHVASGVASVAQPSARIKVEGVTKRLQAAVHRALSIAANIGRRNHCSVGGAERRCSRHLNAAGGIEAEFALTLATTGSWCCGIAQGDPVVPVSAAQSPSGRVQRALFGVEAQVASKALRICARVARALRTLIWTCGVQLNLWLRVTPRHLVCFFMVTDLPQRKSSNFGGWSSVVNTVVTVLDSELKAAAVCPALS
uniref:Apple domain-containing protein n=1 Tax=Macrostomum lignano TaxID=282301 RepID=A0A1I8GEY7_9PLAT